VLVVVLDVLLMRCLLGFDFLVCFVGNCYDTEGCCVFNLLHGDLSVVFKSNLFNLESDTVSN